MSVYYNKVFLLEYTDAKYAGMTFTKDWAKVVMLFIENPTSKDDYVVTTSTLLN